MASMETAPQRPAIDVIVPVYNAAEDLARCVESVLAHTRGDYRLVLIDDASPGAAIRDYFAMLSSRRLPQVSLLTNESNLGFTLTANVGMQTARPGADVVLLNSDTVVTRGWLDKLARCAASDPRIGTVTPFSNNAEICSLPQFCANNPWPAGQDCEPLVRALELAAAPTYPELPTGVGFCFYIRRALIEAIGYFDPVFGLGYGEENDYCLRAAEAGFRNVLCDDAFVLHLGGSSFGKKRADLAERNMKILLTRHPSYLELVHHYIAADPLRALREFALSQYRVLSGAHHGVLHVIHGHGGGTEYHVRALISASSSEFRHYLLIAVGDDWQLEEHCGAAIQAYDFRRSSDEPWRDLLGGLCARFGIDLVHLHNISGCRDGLTTALADLDIAYGYTVHDLNFTCPTITFLDAQQRYCGTVTEPALCNACLGTQTEFATIDIVAWRAQHQALLERAAFVIAPSAWAAATLNRYFPKCAVAVVAHGSGAGMSRDDAVRTRVELPADSVPTIAVIGAIGPDKGARRLERLIALTRERELRLRWVLIGYLDCGRDQWQSGDRVFTQHGPFDSRELSALLEHYRVQLVAYPSAGPETFSFTLSEAWAAGRPVVVPPIGALAERVAQSGAGWVLSEEEWRSEERMLQRIALLVAPASRDALQRAALQACATPQATLDAMAAATVAIWNRAIAESPRCIGCAAIAARRCLDALHYVPWEPPAPATAALPAVAQASAPRGWLGRVAHGALRIRRTLPGRVLYRLTPRPVLEALKARLP